MHFQFNSFSHTPDAAGSIVTPHKERDRFPGQIELQNEITSIFEIIGNCVRQRCVLFVHVSSACNYWLAPLDINCWSNRQRKRVIDLIRCDQVITANARLLGVQLTRFNSVHFKFIFDSDGSRMFFNFTFQN